MNLVYLSPSQSEIVQTIKDRINIIPKGLLILSGKVGSGKTYLLNHLVKSEFTNKSILINLLDYYHEILNSQINMVYDFFSILEKICVEYAKFDYIFLDNIDPLIYIEDEDKFLKIVSSLIRTNFGKKLILVSTYLASAYVRKSPLFSDIPKDILLTLNFDKPDSVFLTYEVRKNIQKNDSLKNFYDIGDII